MIGASPLSARLRCIPFRRHVYLMRSEEEIGHALPSTTSTRAAAQTHRRRVPQTLPRRARRPPRGTALVVLPAGPNSPRSSRTANGSPRPRHSSKKPARALLPLPRGTHDLTVEAGRHPCLWGWPVPRRRAAWTCSTWILLGDAEQEFVCALFARLPLSLAAGQTVQVLVESNPLPPDAVLAMAHELRDDHPSGAP